jgi:probable rRNA maturation factor
MNIFIDNRQSVTEFTRKHGEIIKKAVKEAINTAPFSADFEVSVMIADDRQIHSLNLEHRGIDKPTDVLSFPMISYERAGVPAEAVPKNEVCLLGDIVISAETAARQAEEYGHSFERELAFLTVHSMLHLFGYDHENEQDRVIMREKEEYILQKMGLVR